VFNVCRGRFATHARKFKRSNGQKRFNVLYKIDAPFFRPFSQHSLLCRVIGTAATTKP
jgi:hypothetical protein